MPTDSTPISSLRLRVWPFVRKELGGIFAGLKFFAFAEKLMTPLSKACRKETGAAQPLLTTLN